MEYLIYQNDEVVFKGIDLYDGYFGVYVKSNNVSVQYNFCIEQTILLVHYNNIKKVYNDLNGEYQIDDMDSDSFIKIQFSKFGKITVSGIIGGTHTNNYAVFEFSADQTFVFNLIEFFKKILRS